MTLQLPWPPSANNLFLNAGKHRIRTPTYDAWIASAMRSVLTQNPTKIKGPYRVTIIAERPDKRVRDLSNLIKPLEDLLVKAGVIEDDSLCEQIQIGWSVLPPAKPGRVVITLERAWPSVERAA